ncbi:MAG TPA: condensation domain-containing protein, partial [Gemmatimonadaceae bacterium]|nr:condensation domain-containing protein [Gemmatimonadaceae bacterium]
MKHLGERLAALSPEQRAQLALRLGRSAGAITEAAVPAIPVHSETRFEPFPLTDLQQAYWLGRTDAFALGGIASRAYLELEAPNLDLNRLERAWNALIRRHDMLRAVIGDDGSQRVLPDTPEYRIAVHDLRDATAAEQVERLNERYEHMLRDLRPASEWPLFDIQASILSGGLVRLHVVQDVLNVDGGSMATLF